MVRINTNLLKQSADIKTEKFAHFLLGLLDLRIQILQPGTEKGGRKLREQELEGLIAGSAITGEHEVGVSQSGACCKDLLATKQAQLSRTEPVISSRMNIMAFQTKIVQERVHKRDLSCRLESI